MGNNNKWCLQRLLSQPSFLWLYYILFKALTCSVWTESHFQMSECCRMTKSLSSGQNSDDASPPSVQHSHTFMYMLTQLDPLCLLTFILKSSFPFSGGILSYAVGAADRALKHLKKSRCDISVDRLQRAPIWSRIIALIDSPPLTESI